jgi:hypothetical protein
MKRMSKAAVVVFTGFIVALAVGPEAQAPKGLEGTWKLNATKSSFAPGPPPKAMSVTYSAVGSDVVKIVVDVTPAAGPAQHWEMTAHYDGREYPVKGNPNADMVSLRFIDKLTSESTYKKAGKVTATNTRTLSADGKTLTVTSKGVTEDGKPRNDVQVFEK